MTFSSHGWAEWWETMAWQVGSLSHQLYTYMYSGNLVIKNQTWKVSWNMLPLICVESSLHFCSYISFGGTESQISQWLFFKKVKEILPLVSYHICWYPLSHAFKGLQEINVAPTTLGVFGSEFKNLIAENNLSLGEVLMCRSPWTCSSCRPDTSYM